MRIYKSIVTTITLAGLLATASPVFAQGSPPQIADIGTRILAIADLAFPVSGVVALFMLVFGGYMWMISAGDPQKLQRAQQTMIWAILGFVFLAVMRLILIGVFKFIGVPV